MLTYKSTAVAIAAALALAACSSDPPRTVYLDRPIEVKVPVAVKAEPPAELMKDPAYDPPLFVSPKDPRATVALTAEGEKKLRGFWSQLFGQIDAWRAWAMEPAKLLNGPIAKP